MTNKNEVKQYQKEYQRKWRQKNKEKQREYKKKYRQRNKEHIKEQQKKYYYNNKERYKEYRQKDKEYTKRYQYKKFYNLTLEEADQILIVQNHKCPICGKSLIETRWCVDHNHKTNQVRGVLCINCNAGLGHFYDNLEFLRKAILYIENK